MRITAFLLFGVCAGCAGEHVSHRRHAAMPTDSQADGSENVASDENANVEGWSGRFEISGAPSEDGCDGEVYLAARHISIDVEARTIEADVIDRVYSITELVPGQLIAEGRFATDACPESTLFERWTFEADGDAWTGTLESTWPDASDCGRPCTVRFELRAQRIAE